MIDTDTEFERQVTGLIAESHDWVIYLTDSSASPITKVILDTEIGSMSGIDHTLEKDWSYFMAGDVSFTVHDLDNSLRTFLDTKTKPFKINIYAQYSNTRCLCFSGYLKIGDTQISENDVTLYAISTYGWLEQYPYIQPETLTGIQTLRKVLVNGELQSSGIVNGFDLTLGVMDRPSVVNKEALFQTTAEFQRHSEPVDCIQYNEDDEKYHVLVFRRGYTITTAIGIYKAYIYKSDPSKIQELSDLFAVTLPQPVKHIRALAGGRPFFILLLIGYQEAHSGFRTIMMVDVTALETEPPRLWHFSDHWGASMIDYFGIMNSAGIDENDNWLCFAAEKNPGQFPPIPDTDYYAVKINLANIWTNQGYESIVAGGLYNILSGDLTYDNQSGYYYYVTIERYATFPPYYNYHYSLALYRWNTGSIAFVERRSLTDTTSIINFTVAGTKRYFFLNHFSRYYNAFTRNWTFLNIPYYLAKTISINKFEIKYVLGIDAYDLSTRFIYRWFVRNGSYLEMKNYTYDDLIGGNTYLSNFQKISGIDIDEDSGGYANDILLMPERDQYSVLSKRIPLLLSMTDDSRNKILDKISLKEFIRQAVGCYLLTAHIHKENNQNILIVKPRSGIYPYSISPDSIVMDSVEIDDLPNFQIELITQGHTFHYPSEVDPTKETLSFTFNCLPPALGDDIAYYLYQQFQNWIHKRIKFKADSVFFIEPADWVRFRDSNTLKTYDGVIMKNFIPPNDNNDIEILGKEV